MNERARTYLQLMASAQSYINLSTATVLMTEPNECLPSSLREPRPLSAAAILVMANTVDEPDTIDTASFSDEMQPRRRSPRRGSRHITTNNCQARAHIRARRSEDVAR